MSSENIAEEHRKIFSNNLRFYMKRERITQDDIVRRLNVSSSTVSDWCNAKKYPRVGKMQELADLLNVSLSELRDPLMSANGQGTDPNDDTIEILYRKAKSMTKEQRETLIKLANVIFREDFGE